MADPTTTRKKSEAAFRTIGEVAVELALPQHVLRFWETKFSRIRPHKRRGGHRYYRPADVDLLKEIKFLLYENGYTIKGAQKYLDEHWNNEAQAQRAAFAQTTGGRAAERIEGKQAEKLHRVKSELSELKKLLNNELTDIN